MNLFRYTGYRPQRWNNYNEIKKNLTVMKVGSNILIFQIYIFIQYY